MKTGLIRTLEDLMVAVTFAEKNQHEYALKLMDGHRKKQSRQLKNKVDQRAEQRPRMRV
jgi:hypothetical protein